MIIENGTGDKVAAQVDENHHLHVQSESIPRQSVISQRDGQTYQLIGDRIFTTGTTSNVLHVKNNSESLSMVITYMRIEAAGQTAPTFGQATFWEIGTGLTFASGGTTITPVNVNLSSGNDADVTAFDNDATLTGSFTEIDRFYPKEDNQEERYNKEGSLILSKNDTLTIRYTSDATAGLAYARISFYMAKLEAAV